MSYNHTIIVILLVLSTYASEVLKELNIGTRISQDSLLVTVGEDALLCVQLPLDVSSPLVLKVEAVTHNSRWLVAEDGIGKWLLILLVSKQELI